MKQKCIYSYIFETPPPQDAEMLRLYPKVPHPFVIEPPATEKQTFAAGEELSFHLILIGNAIDYLPYFIYTFTELGKQGIGQGRGKYTLLQVEGISLENEPVQIYHNKTQTLTSNYPIIQASQIGRHSSETHNERAPQPNSHNQGERQLESPCQEGQVLNNQIALGLTEEQVVSVKRLLNETHSRILDFRTDLDRAVERQNAALEPRRVDEAAALGLADQVMRLEADVKKTHLRLLIQLKKLLTPAQQDKLREMRPRPPQE